jgi:hypothetical protein
MREADVAIRLRRPRQPDLVQVVLAPCSPGRFPGLLDCRKQQCDENPDDRRCNIVQMDAYPGSKCPPLDVRNGEAGH